MLPNLSSHDLCQRYQDSYIKLSIQGEPRIVYVSGISQELISLQGVGTFESKQVEILKEFPEMGLVNFEGNVHIISRKPMRQWCRGLKTGLIHDVCRNKNVILFSASLSHKRAEALFNRKWLPLNDGLAHLRVGTLSSFAINNNYWFSGNSKHQYIWRNGVCIGEILGKRVFFFSESLSLREEISTDLKDFYVHI